MNDDGPTYYMHGEEIPLNILDMMLEYVDEFMEIGIPKKQYQPFLRSLLEDCAELDTLPKKKKLIRKRCQNFINQWDRVIP